MRRIWALLAFVALFAVPVVASADAPPDGTLVVKNGDAKIFVNATGALIGTLDKGRVTLIDPIETNRDDLQLKGCDSAPALKDNSISCTGSDLRYRVVEGRFKVRINGTGIDLSTVGTGANGDTSITLNGGSDFGDPDGSYGTYKVNDKGAQKIPEKQVAFNLAG